MPEEKPVVDLPSPGKYGFVGREAEMVSLELALKQAHTVLLTGPAGAGKTELASAVARRMADKGCLRAGAIFTSFEYGAGLRRALHEMGTALRGISFARLTLEHQRQWAIDYLRQNQCLLIWDHFQVVFDRLGNPGIQELLDFLKDKGDSLGYLLITGRDRDWADQGGLAYRHEELRGLNDDDARQLARLILDDGAGDHGRLDAEYAELLRLLQGNPMSMQVVLPHLKGDTAPHLLEGFKELTRGGGHERNIVDLALDLSFSRLSPRTVTHLPLLSLFRQRVLLDVLTFMTQGEVYVSVMGEEMGWGACRTFLREARDHGILDSVSPSVYLIHPTVGAFLRRRLNYSLSAAQIETLEREFVRVYADMADYFLENLSSESSESTVTGVLAEEPNLLQALSRAENEGDWEAVQLILQPIAQVYKMQERVLELRLLREHLLARAGPTAESAQRRGAAQLWLYLQGTEVNDAIDRQELDRAEDICQAVLTYLEPRGDPGEKPQMASIYHYLGLIAQGKALYDEAEAYYGKAMQIAEPLGNEAECADNYHQLGLIYQSRQAYREAQEWHHRALDIRERLGDEAEGAEECYQLALTLVAQHEVGDALEWYHRARGVYEHLGDKASAAAVYHRLGLMAQGQYQYEEATDWYQRALLAHEELGDESPGANNCYQLGGIALERYEYDEAKDWFRRALEGFELLGNEDALANSYHQLGVAAHARMRFQEAEGWYQKALELFLRREDEVAASSTWGQLGLLAEQLGNYPLAVWYVAHTYEIAAARELPALRQAIIHLSHLRSKMGTEEFIRCWHEISDTDVLPQLE